MIRTLATALATTTCLVALATPAAAQTREFNVPAGSLRAALDTFARQSGRQVIYRGDEVRSAKSPGVSGAHAADEALQALLAGTGFTAKKDSTGAFAVVKVGNAPAAADSVASSGEYDKSPAKSESADIVVTGSHIRGVDPTSPVRTITRKEIDNSGYSQVGDLIRSLPENFSGGQNPGVVLGSSGFQNQNFSNASTVNLRGLGTDATLVLVNGNRLAADTLFQGSDISGVPLAAISRVEVVPDGASAVYGSDAVAGVVNFILRKDFNGGMASARLGTMTQGGGGEQTYSLLEGVSRSKWHALANLEFSKQNAVTAGERDFTSAAAPGNTLLQPQKRWSLYSNIGWDVSDRLTVSADILLNDRNTSSRGEAYSSISVSHINTKSYSISPSLSYRVVSDWSLKIDGTFAGSINNRTIDSIYPGGATTSVLRYKNTMDSIEANANGSLLHLAGGDLKVALGAGYRRTAFSYGLPQSVGSFSNNEDIRYVYGETFIPIVGPSNAMPFIRALDLSLSVRSENYSTFGSTTNPKVGLSYKPFGDLSIRGSWGRSFKAPSLYQRYGGYYLFLTDTSLFGLPAGKQVLIANGQNVDLKPERATVWTTGADYSPSWDKQLKLSATYFNIRYVDRVVTPISTFTSAFDPSYAEFVSLNPPSSRSSPLVGGAQTLLNFAGAPFDPSIVYAIVDNRLANATSQSANGIDVALHKDISLGSSSVSVFTNATFIKLTQKLISTSPSERISGTVYNVPKFKLRGGASWQHGGLMLSAAVNHISSELDTGVIPSARISAWTTLDANLAYSIKAKSGIFGGTKLALSAINIFDKDPPRVQSATYYGTPFDSTNHSVLGRQLSLTLSKEW